MNNNSKKREVIHRKQQNTGECHEATAWTSFLQRNPQIVYTVQTIIDWFVTKASFAHYKSDHGGPVTTVNEVPNWLFILTFTTFFLSQISLFSWHFWWTNVLPTMNHTMNIKETLRYGLGSTIKEVSYLVQQICLYMR